MGDWVLRLTENDADILTPLARGPYLVAGRRGGYYDLVVHILNEHDTCSAYVAALTAFNKQRATARDEAEYALSEGHHLVDSIESHTEGPEGLVFRVKWHNGVVTQQDGEALAKVAIFKDYIKTHKITAAMLKRKQKPSEMKAVTQSTAAADTEEDETRRVTRAQHKARMTS